MPYVSRDIYGWLFYSYGTDVLSSFGGAYANTNSVTPVKLFEFELKNKIQRLSKFTFSFDLRRESGAMTVSAQVYRNGVAIGTARNTSSPSYVNFQEDINQTNWVMGDKIQLYGWADSTANVCNCMNFQIRGLGSQWENTYIKP